jgi:uncharacterized protein (DUF2147 family)
LRWFAALVCAVCAGLALPADVIPVTGLWKTFDDNTGQARGLVRIYAEGGRIFGRIEGGVDPREAQRVCNLCTDERRDQPLRGMVILRGLRAEGDEYVDGDILDPDNGKVYRCKVRLEDGGRKLVVRGYIGISLFGRSQTWERIR